MTATNDSTTGRLAQINVTPMVDVLLVLLIIFMVIVPALPRGEAALAPRPAHNAVAQPDAIFLEVSKSAGNTINFRVNQQQVAQGDLQSRLAAIYANRAHRVLFLKGDDGLSFAQIAETIDLCHSAGIDQIGLMTPGTNTGK